MIDINVLMSVILRIRNSADQITTSGRENLARVSFIYDTCTELLNQLEDIRVKNQQKTEPEATSNDDTAGA